MFDHRSAVSGLRWRIMAPNRASSALMRRLGFTEFETKSQPALDGCVYYRASRSDWEARKRKLGAGLEFECSATKDALVPLGFDRLKGAREHDCAGGR
jgi:hypothetical protein